jgi:hypothetical protein
MYLSEKISFENSLNLFSKIYFVIAINTKARTKTMVAQSLLSIDLK